VQYRLTPYAFSTPPCAWWDGAFTDDELNQLENEALSAQIRAITGNAQSEDLDEIRRSHVKWFDCDSKNQWVYEKLAHVVSSLNSQHFYYDLSGFAEPFQLTKYEMSQQGMYTWHTDSGAGGKPCRKLSLVIQLTDPSKYEGGNLQLCVGKDPITIEKRRGLITVFPSFVLHQVTPVVSGVRTSLVSWISGPPFR